MFLYGILKEYTNAEETAAVRVFAEKIQSYAAEALCFLENKPLSQE